MFIEFLTIYSFLALVTHIVLTILYYIPLNTRLKETFGITTMSFHFFMYPLLSFIAWWLIFPALLINKKKLIEGVVEEINNDK